MAINKRIIRSNDEGGAGLSFNTVTYADTTTSVPHSVGFAPDLVWFKERNGTNSHQLYDTVRGSDYALGSNTTAAEYNYSTHPSGNLAPLITSTGFTTPSVVNNGINRNGGTYVAWCWKAGGAAVENTDGTITSQVSANTEAGFSIVSYEGNYTANQTVGHGLGKAPDVLIVKARQVASSWPVWHKDLTSADYTLELDTTDAEASVSSRFGSLPTSSVFTVGGSGFTNAPPPDNEMIAYCFTEVAGFSKFGSYNGIDGTDVKVYTDSNGDGTGIGAFQPRFVMIKVHNNIGGWAMFDALRDGGNPTYNLIFANYSNAESTYSNVYGVQFDSDGFTVKGYVGGNDTINETGGSYIFMAFA